MTDAAYQLAYYYKKRQQQLDYLGGKCAICGATEDLQIDHIDPAEKLFDIKYTMSFRDPLLIAELAKCQVLCRKHHEEKTAAELSGWTHGTMNAWQKEGCRCDICKPLWRSWHDARNLRRRKK